MRDPYSEGASQLGVFAALWCIGRAYQTGGMRWGVLAGTSLGMCFLVRIDSPLLLAGIVPGVVVLQASAARRRLATRAFIPLSIVFAARGTIHGWMFSRNYVQDLSSQLIPLWGLTVAAVGLSFAALLLRADATGHRVGSREREPTLGRNRDGIVRRVFPRSLGSAVHGTVSGQRVGTANVTTNKRSSEWRGISRRRGWWLHSVAY